MSLKTSQGQQRGNLGHAFDEAQAKQQPAGQQASSQQAQASHQDPLLSFRALGSMFEMPAAANAQSEVLTKARAVVDADLKSLPDSTFDIRVVALDRENPALNLGVSLLVICVSLKQQPQLGVGYHALLLAESAPEPNPVSVNIGQGRTVELKQVIGDAYDEIMRAEIRKELGRQFPNVPLHSGEGRVVRADFKWSEENAEKFLRVDAVSAATMALAKSIPGFRDLNLRKIEQDGTLTLNTQFHQPQLVDTTGQAVRADVRVVFRAGQAQRNQQVQQSQNLEKPTDITRIAGFIDLIHQRQPQINPYLPPQFQFQPGQNIEQFKQFIPRFVITNLRTDNGATLGKQLLALLTVYTLRKPGAWYPAFKPQYNLGRDKDLDIKDIGAIGLETMIDPATGVGTRINTKTDTFRAQDQGALLHATVRDGLVISLDVEECGDSTWPNVDFAEAARMPNSQEEAARKREASEKLYDAVNYLTNGGLEKTGFVRGSEICFNENNRIVLGNYPGADGELRDVRDVDTVAMYNLMGERDIKVARDWTDTYLRSDLPIEQRLDARIHILQTLIPSLKITGFATRITFRDDFLQAFTTAAAGTGLAIRESAPFGEVQGFDVPQYQFVQQALGGYQTTNLFQQGGLNPQPGGQFGGAWRGRWN